MSSSIEEGTLNLKGDNGQTLQDIITVSEVKEMECEVGNLVVSKTSPHSFEQLQDQLVGDDIISQTSIESSNNFISHSPFYDKHDLVLENISCSLKEHMMGVDQFIQGERTKPQFKKHIPIISRDTFCLLNYSTYYSLYPDIFYPNVVQLCVPDYLGENSTLYNQVQINRDYQIEDKEENNSSHEHINSYSHQLSVGKSRNDLKESQIASSIDSSQFVFKEGSEFFHNKLFEIENYNQPNTTTSDDYSKMLVVPFSSSQVVNAEAFKLNEKFQENETLLLQLKIMISSCYLDPTNNIMILLQDSFHTNMVPYFHQKYFSSMNSFEQSYIGNCTYYDRIAYWLGVSYLEKFQGMVRLSSPYLEIKEVTLTHSFYILQMEKIWNKRRTVGRIRMAGGFIHQRMFKGMVRSCLLCF
jgi:hypothetical protein